MATGKFYKVVGLKEYDPDFYQAKKFIGRKCEMMGALGGAVSKNYDGSYRGNFDFRDEFKVHTFEGLMIEPWPEAREDEEDIL
jgi:hypothetical protein